MFLKNKKMYSAKIINLLRLKFKLIKKKMLIFPNSVKLKTKFPKCKTQKKLKNISEKS